MVNKLIDYKIIGWKLDNYLVYRKERREGKKRRREDVEGGLGAKSTFILKNVRINSELGL